LLAIAAPSRTARSLAQAIWEGEASIFEAQEKSNVTV